MSVRKSKQMVTGKAFEYALLTQFQERLKHKTNVEVINNSSLCIAKECFELTSENEQSDYLLTASFTINFLIDIEPRLSHDIGEKDTLQLEILSDDYGRSGDVRDVLAIRLLQRWEIGISAKNNHRAVKHSRLSSSIDFGEKWVGTKVSQNYFDSVDLIFSKLRKYREESNATMKWNELSDHHNTVYVPVLEAFIEEMMNFNNTVDEFSSKLVSYLVGNKDYYKVIKSKNKVEIEAYNINGTLNLPFNGIMPKFKTPVVPLPTMITDIAFKENSKTTVIVTMNNGWVLSFRIHNASSRVEPSLKFDITLLESPKKLFKNTLSIK